MLLAPTRAGARTPAEPPAIDDDARWTCDAPIEACGALPFEGPGPRTYRCDLEHPTLAGVTALAVATESALYLIRGGDPEPLEAHRTPLLPDEQTTSLGTPSILVRGSWIAARFSLNPHYAGGHALEVLIVDSAGRPVFNEIHRTPARPFPEVDLVGNDRSLFVFSTGRLGEAQVHRIIEPSGVRTVTASFTVAADPAPDGWILVNDILEPGRNYDWYDLRGLSRRPSCYRQQPVSLTIDVLSPGIVYVVRESSSLVYERAFERCEIRVPSAPPPRYEIFGTNRQGWVHLGRRADSLDEELRLLAANVATGARVPAHRLIPPSGHALPEGRWDPSPPKATVDLAGATATFLSRTDEEGATYYRLHRTLDGVDWEPLGNELLLHPGAVRGRAVWEVSGTYLLGGYRLIDGAGWYRTHLIRPASNFVRDVPGFFAGPHKTHVISEDGCCVAGFVEGRLEVLDTTTGTTYLGPRIDEREAQNAAIAFVPVTAE